MSVRSDFSSASGVTRHLLTTEYLIARQISQEWVHCHQATFSYLGGNVMITITVAWTCRNFRHARRGQTGRRTALQSRQQIAMFKFGHKKKAQVTESLPTKTGAPVSNVRLGDDASGGDLKLLDPIPQVRRAFLMTTSSVPPSAEAQVGSAYAGPLGYGAI